MVIFGLNPNTVAELQMVHEDCDGFGKFRLQPHKSALLLSFLEVFWSDESLIQNLIIQQECACQVCLVSEASNRNLSKLFSL